MSALLSINKLSLRYGNHVILNTLDLHLAAGKVISVLGSNGAGKSSLLKCILGLQEASAELQGEVLIAGYNVLTDAKAARQHLAYLPEQAAVYEHLSAVDNIAYFLSISGTNSLADIEASLSQVGLPERAWHQACHTYSKGMRQKVMLALALAKQAKLLLLDEPNSGLDPQATEELNQLILKCKSNRMGVLVVTHDVISAIQFSDQLCMLHDGKLKPIQLDPSQFTLTTLQQLYQGQY